MVYADIFADIYFYKTEDNGRKTPTSSNFFSCVFIVDDKKHDCRLLLNDIGSIAPGETKFNVPIKFLCPELVFSKIRIGSKFYLWDMRNIAEGEIKEIIN